METPAAMRTRRLASRVVATACPGARDLADESAFANYKPRIPMQIRRYLPGEGYELRQVFMSSVHTLAYRFYSQQQLNAWAPAAFGKEEWEQKIAAMNPFVALVGGRVAGYAGMLESGRIEHLFVRGEFAGTGIGTALMGRLQSVASELAVARLHADVSLSAEGFFMRSGFDVQQRQTVVRRGVALEHARMVKVLAAAPERSAFPTTGSVRSASTIEMDTRRSAAESGGDGGGRASACQDA